MKSSKTIHMTEGNEVTQILRFMLPMLVGAAFQQLYTFVDSIVVGRYVGPVALGSVGAAAGIVNLFMALCVGLSGGVNICAAQSFGAGDEKKLKQVVANSVYVTLASGLVMGLIGLILARPILLLMGTPAENLTYALVYMRLVCGAMVITAAYNTIFQILRALGDSVTPLIYIVISSLINVGMDIVLVLYFSMGVAGVAIATVVAQGVSVIGLWLHGKKHLACMQLQGQDMQPDWHLIQKICELGIPLALQNAMASISGVVCQGIVNSFGSQVMSAYTIVCRLNEFFMLPFGYYGMAMANFAGQNTGAGKHDRIYRGCRRSLYITSIYSLVCMAIILAGRRILVGMFVDDVTVAELAIPGLLLNGVCMLIRQIIYIYKATLNGAGDAFFTLWNGVVEVVANILFMFACTSWLSLGHMGIWYSMIPAAVLSAMLSAGRFYSGKWKQKRIF